MTDYTPTAYVGDPAYLPARADLAAVGVKAAAGDGEADAMFADGPVLPDYLIADGPGDGER